MRDQTFLHKLKFEYNALLAGYHRRRGQIERARKRLDLALSLNLHPPHYLLAFDAQLMIDEGRHEEAVTRLRECLARLPEKLDSEAKYVSLHCELALSIYDVTCSHGKLEELWDKISSHEGETVEFYLRLPPKAVLVEIFGERPHIAARARLPEMKSRMTGAETVSFGSGFDVR